MPGRVRFVAGDVAAVVRCDQSLQLSGIPLFVFTGGILAEGGIAKTLTDLAIITIGRGRGGMGASIVASAMVFHRISGSFSADAAAIGKVTLPTLRAQGYPLPFSIALLATAGATGTLIPPTNDLIIIGIVGNMSIAGPILRRNTPGLPQRSRARSTSRGAAAMAMSHSY